MSTFAIQATLINPEHRDRFAVVDFLVDTGATYMMIPRELVAELALATPFDQAAILATGDRVVFPMGEVRCRLGSRELPTVFLVGPLGSRPLLGAFTLEAFSVAADPVNGRLIPVPALL